MFSGESYSTGAPIVIQNDGARKKIRPVYGVFSMNGCGRSTSGIAAHSS